MTLHDIQNKINDNRQHIDDAVLRFRLRTKEEGWIMKRMRPRDRDEIQALNLILRQSLRRAMQEGKVSYNQEKRVMFIDRLTHL